ncbi:MAG: GNAT family N-acetyltransferase [Spirochaetes bacterium]|nr:GNAT family N-acetyltransferase [Spirochaetota bacterium]
MNNNQDKSVVIKSFHPVDIPYLMDACLKTGNKGGDGTHLYSDPWFVGQQYMLPYVIHSPQLCLVAHLDHQPQGYILGASDTKSFYHWMEEQWLPPLRLLYPLNGQCKSEMEKSFLEYLHEDHKAFEFPQDYPAHLHINLLPSCQGKGVGKKLMEGFCQLLAQANVAGVYLQVGADNSRAVGFYQKLDFHILKESDDTILMVRKIIQ